MSKHIKHGVAAFFAAICLMYAIWAFIQADAFWLRDLWAWHPMERAALLYGLVILPAIVAFAAIGLSRLER